MFNDKLGQISLDRIKKKNRQKIKRKTQSLVNLKNANSYSVSAEKRYTANIFSVSGDDVFVNYENTNPENSIRRNTGFSYGNPVSDKYKSFDESNLSYNDKIENIEKTEANFFQNIYTQKELANARYDVFKRCTDITKIKENYPFPSENTNSAKCFLGSGFDQKSSLSQIVTNEYEDFDVKAPFIDNHSFEIRENVYIVEKNYYNNGNSKTFSEKDNVKNNSILKTKDGNDQYYKSNNFFKTSGFVYKSKRPDSIAFGGLKR